MMTNRTLYRGLAWAAALANAIAAASGAELEKLRIDQFLAPSCSAIANQANAFPSDRISRATQYFIPIFTPGPDGKLRAQDKHACLNVEGSCIVGDGIYNYPSDTGISRATIAWKFGMGSGAGSYNTTNALDPCRSLAADQTFYRAGTVVFIGSMQGKICPQSGKPVDGCFVVADKGSAIKGRGRFDVFTGECAHYNEASSTCGDASNDAYQIRSGTEFRVIPRENDLAVGLRRETDANIRRGWKAF